MTPRSLYLHVPFCARRCPYCDFAVHATRRPAVRAWVDAVDREFAMVRAREGWDAPLELDTIYVGGGTPSLLGADGMAELRGRLIQHATWTADVEWTAEANPESFDDATAVAWRSAGVNRLSIGIQSFAPQVLRWMGRLHGADGARAAVRTARAAGFDNVSVDLIFALPVRLHRDWRADLAQALELEPEHVSLYGLSAESGAALGRWVREGRETMPPDSTYAEEFMEASTVLRAAGYEQYEVSNFARPGRRSRHNQAYWTGAPYLGLGPSAHSFLPPNRRWNLRDWASYRAALDAGESAIQAQEEPDAGAHRLEQIWLGLRTVEGTSAQGLSVAQRALVEVWARDGLAHAPSASVRLTPRGWLHLDSLAVALAAAED